MLDESFRGMVERAYGKARELEERLPTYRGIRPLLGWEGAIADRLLLPEIGRWLFDRLSEEFKQGTKILFPVGGPLSESFSSANDGFFLIQAAPDPTTTPQVVKGRVRSTIRLIREVRQDHDYARLWFGPLEALDTRYQVRQRSVVRRPYDRGGIWCFSSYINYSRALAKHAQHLETPPQWLVNGRSPRAGLPRGTGSVPLWQFGPTRTPEHQATVRAARDVADDPALLPLVRDHLAGLLAEIDLLEGFLKQTGPAELWVANQWGSESAALQLAAREGISTTQVQHGVLEQYYAFAPIRSSRFLVWGEFWKSLLPRSEQSVVAVDDPGGWSAPRTGTPEQVAFFSQPLGTYPLVNAETFFREVIDLLSGLRERGMEVVLRVHPQERVDDWMRAWDRWGVGPTLPIDKHGSLDDTLRRTAVAITPLSTVMLSCVARAIPVVTLGWYGSVWKDALRQSGSVAVAGSISEAISLVESARQDGTEGDATRFLQSLGSRRGGAGS
ncbi:MAG: hypothetical protein M3P11_13465 [Actinomycetota bacterium]|nr:hypothetical protein [Actinomycetota bacterium]